MLHEKPEMKWLEIERKIADSVRKSTKKNGWFVYGSGDADDAQLVHTNVWKQF